MLHEDSSESTLHSSITLKIGCKQASRENNHNKHAISNGDEQAMESSWEQGNDLETTSKNNTNSDNQEHHHDEDATKGNLSETEKEAAAAGKAAYSIKKKEILQEGYQQQALNAAQSNKHSMTANSNNTSTKEMYTSNVPMTSMVKILPNPYRYRFSCQTRM